MSVKFELKRQRNPTPKTVYSFELIDITFINTVQVTSLNLTLFNTLFKVYREKHVNDITSQSNCFHVSTSDEICTIDETDWADGIYCKIFQTYEEYIDFDLTSLSMACSLLYYGASDNISEELAKNLVYIRPYVNTYLNYRNNNNIVNDHLHTAKESVQTLGKYVIFYKK